MDQNAFRNLLSAPRDPSTSTSSTSNSKRTLGGAGSAPKRGWGLKPKDSKAYEKPKEEEEESKPVFAPRAIHKRILEEGGYKDRAALRRKGVDDEYKSVEKLLEDFERKAKESGADEEEIRRQRAYLGGDAEHSILVKGLDYALLAARKAELAKENEQDEDDELDALANGIRPTGRKAAAEGEGEGGMKKKVPEERLGKGFKSIGQNEAGQSEKKKKKKKKKVVEAEADIKSSGPSMSEPIRSRQAESSKAAGPSHSQLPTTSSSKFKLEPAALPPPAEEEEEDIFADVGEYDLGANIPSDDDEEEEEQKVKKSGKRVDIGARRQTDGLEPRGRGRQDARSRSWSRSRSRSAPRRYSSREDDSPIRRYSHRRDGNGDHARRERSNSRSRSRSRIRDGDRDRDAYRRDKSDLGDPGRYPQNGRSSRYNDREGASYYTDTNRNGRRSPERSYGVRSEAYRRASQSSRYDDRGPPSPRRNDRDRSRSRTYSPYRDSKRRRYDDSRSPPPRSPQRYRKDSPVHRSGERNGRNDRDRDYEYDSRPRSRSRSRSDSRARPRPRSPSPAFRRYRDRSTRSPSPQHRPERYRRSPPTAAAAPSASVRPPTISHATNSVPAPVKRGRSLSRSPTPPLFATVPPPLSRSPSPTSSTASASASRVPHIPTKLVPLHNSSMADVKSFLSYDADASKADEKRAKKAAWRAKQGLGMQDDAGGVGRGGGGGSGEKEKKNEKIRANNDYVKVMRKLDQGKSGSGGGAGGAE